MWINKIHILQYFSDKNMAESQEHPAEGSRSQKTQHHESIYVMLQNRQNHSQCGSVGVDWLQRTPGKPLGTMEIVCVFLWFFFFFFFLALLHGLWDPSFLVKDWTQAPSSESSECQPLNCQEIPKIFYILIVVGGYTALYICKCIHSNSWKCTLKVSKFYCMQLNLNNIVFKKKDRKILVSWDKSQKDKSGRNSVFFCMVSAYPLFILPTNPFHLPPDGSSWTNG